MWKPRARCEQGGFTPSGRVRESERARDGFRKSRKEKDEKEEEEEEERGYKRKREEQKRDATVEEGMQGGKRWSEGLKGHKG